MTITRSILRVAATGTMLLSVSGVAMADSTLDGTTGPHSTNTVSTTTTWTNTVTNNNSVVIVNANVQLSSTGDATAKDNTVVGNVGSGNASNNNNTTTTVDIDNSGSTPCSCDPGDGGNGGNGGSGGSSGGSGGSSGGSGGEVLGASTGSGSGSAEELPAVGASVPMDVSALRALYHAATVTPATKLAQNDPGISLALLALATLLSLAGAFGSVFYAQRKEIKA